MGNNNSTNDKIKNFFERDVKDVFGKIGSIGGSFVKFGENMLQNMMKMSNNLGNLMGSSVFPYIVICIGGIFVLFKLKMI